MKSYPISEEVTAGSISLVLVRDPHRPQGSKIERERMRDQEVSPGN